MIEALLRYRSRRHARQARGGALSPLRPNSFLAKLRRCLTDASGIAALEFAASAPMLILMFAGVSDISVAIWDHTTTAAAVEAGADYALYEVAQGVDSSGVSTYLTNVGNVVTAASRTGVTLSVSSVVVLWNGVADNTNFNHAYCLPATWIPGNAWPGVATGGAGSTCSDGMTTAGSFVVIEATYAYTPMSPADAAFMSGNYTDTAVVRVQ